MIQGNQQYKILDSKAPDNITGISLGILKAISIKIQNGQITLSRAMECIHRSIRKDSQRPCIDNSRFLKGRDTSTFANIHPENSQVAHADIGKPTTIELNQKKVTLNTIPFLKQKDAVKIISLLEVRLGELRDNLNFENTVLFCSLILPILGTCHIFADGNGRANYSIVKILIDTFTDQTLNLQLFHEKDEDIQRQLTNCSLILMPRKYNVLERLKRLQAGDSEFIDYENIIKDDPTFLPRYAEIVYNFVEMNTRSFELMQATFEKYGNFNAVGEIIKNCCTSKMRV